MGDERTRQSSIILFTPMVVVTNVTRNLGKHRGEPFLQLSLLYHLHFTPIFFEIIEIRQSNVDIVNSMGKTIIDIDFEAINEKSALSNYDGMIFLYLYNFNLLYCILLPLMHT